MKNINNNFNEIIIGKTLSKQLTTTKEVKNDEFSSLLNNNSAKKEDEKSSVNLTNQQLELQNLSYLNKVYLSFVA